MLEQRDHTLIAELDAVKAEARHLREANLDLQIVVNQLRESQAILERNRWLEQELELAARIQMSLVPRRLEARGLELAARMTPAHSAGGDYYDVIPAVDGCFIGIGDASGHGLSAGLLMMMVQAAVAGACLGSSAGANPSTILAIVNQILFENIRQRLRTEDFVTCTLLRHGPGGAITFAGAHEDIIVLRTDGSVEILPTRGPWLGTKPELAASKFCDQTMTLRKGDVVVLYTDGITEARRRDGATFDIGRLAQTVSAERSREVNQICDVVFDAVAKWAALQEDDRTVVVFRQIE